MQGQLHSKWPEANMAQEEYFRVRILLPSLKAIRGLAVDNEGMPIRRRQDRQIEMQAIVPQSTLTKLRLMQRRRVSVEVPSGPGATDANREASKMISRTNRYGDGSLPRGLGSRRDETMYHNVDEIESAITNLASA